MSVGIVNNDANTSTTQNYATLKSPSRKRTASKDIDTQRNKVIRKEDNSTSVPTNGSAASPLSTTDTSTYCHGTTKHIDALDTLESISAHTTIDSNVSAQPSETTEAPTDTASKPYETEPSKSQRDESKNDSSQSGNSAQSNDTNEKKNDAKDDENTDSSSDEEDSNDDDDEDTIVVQMNNLQRYLECPLCRGYLRDAHTVPECLHSFCKVCLVRYCAVVSACCPICHVCVGDPFTSAKPDTVLQGVVDLVLSSEEVKSHLSNYLHTSSGGDTPTPSSVSIASPTLQRNNSTSDSFAPPTPPPPETLSLKDYKIPSLPYICVEMKPSNKDMTPLEKPFLRTFGSITIKALLQYLGMKLQMPWEKIILKCRDVPVRGREHQLAFISRTMWRNKQKDMVLHYSKK